MLVDTHCHMNMMVKEAFDRSLTLEEIAAVNTIVYQAKLQEVTTIINVGTSLVESKNCIALAQQYNAVYATVGIHPNDLTSNWKSDFKELKKLVQNKEANKIVGIGECGLDYHYPDYNKQQQYDAFKGQIELASEYNLALVIHTRDAHDETLRSIQEFKGQITGGIIHCFSEGHDFARQATEWGFVLGIGGTLSYPKNTILREIFKNIALEKIVLETDAPFLPPQPLRGQQNTPANIQMIARYLAELRNESFETIAQTTTANALKVFNIT